MVTTGHSDTQKLLQAANIAESFKKKMIDICDEVIAKFNEVK